jgi:decaprenylphospho-beta-D-ribofuranose 2-oxidase
MSASAHRIWPGGPELPQLLRTMDGGVSARAIVLRPDRHGFFTPGPDGTASVARGGGLSYAAASFGAGIKSIDLGAFDRVLDFDQQTGDVEVEAGITLGALYRFLAPRGRYLPVQPGYVSITVGGCIGSDVHGKNPARDGTFIAQVASLRLFHPDHGIILLSDMQDAELFRATCGGLGLTGIIVAATLRTRALPGWSTETTITPVGNATEAAAALPQIARGTDLAYAWLDCARPRAGSFGRGLMFDIRITEGGTPDVGKLRAPLSAANCNRAPLCLMNRWSVRAINLAHAHRSRRAAGRRDSGLLNVLFPILGNELYFHLFGRAGFHEYQAILPRARAGDYLELARELSARGNVCITHAIVRPFTGRNDLLRFDGDGISVGLHVPRNRRSGPFLAGLDRFVIEAGGRPNIYKDSRLPRAVFEATYPEAEKFRAIRRAWDPRRRFRSELADRLAL